MALTRYTDIPGAPAWLQLQTADVEQSKAFYSELFGWSFHSAYVDQDEHLLIEKDGDLVGSLAPDSGSFELPHGWIVFLNTPNLTRSMDAAREQGCVPKYLGPKGNSADIALLHDTSGAFVGAWKPQEISGVSTELGADRPVWFSLHTPNYQSSLSFYNHVFAWSVLEESTPEGTAVARLASEHDTRAMIAEYPDNSSAQWTVHFGSANIENTLTVVTQSGGSVITPPRETPWGVISHVRDVQGAEFYVQQELVR